MSCVSLQPAASADLKIAMHREEPVAMADKEAATFLSLLVFSRVSSRPEAVANGVYEIGDHVFVEVNVAVKLRQHESESENLAHTK